jgi:hypothetical protein
VPDALAISAGRRPRTQSAATEGPCRIWLRGTGLVPGAIRVFAPEDHFLELAAVTSRARFAVIGDQKSLRESKTMSIH